MQVINVPLSSLVEAGWNANVVPASMIEKLKKSLAQFGLVTNLVARPLADGQYEVLSGNQRLQVLREMGVESAPCVIVELGDARARLLAQALNRVHGEDDPGLRAELLKEVLAQVPQEEVVELLPETTQSLQTLASLGKEDMAAYLQDWQKSQSARLKHLTFQSTPDQLQVIEEALARVMPQVKGTGPVNPNPRGNALFRLCQHYLELVRSDS